MFICRLLQSPCFMPDGMFFPEDLEQHGNKLHVNYPCNSTNKLINDFCELTILLPYYFNDTMNWISFLQGNHVVIKMTLHMI